VRKKPLQQLQPLRLSTVAVDAAAAAVDGGVEVESLVAAAEVVEGGVVEATNVVSPLDQTVSHYY